MNARSRENSVFAVEADGKFYVQDASGAFLGKDGRWTVDIEQAWLADDSEHARSVARQQNEQRERDIARARP